MKPQSLNRYSYALNDPVNLADPSGAFPVFTYSCEETLGGPEFCSYDYLGDLNLGTPLPQQASSEGSGGSGQAAGVRKLDPNSQECKDLARKVDNIASDIVKRMQEIESNPQNLPETAPAGSPLRDSVAGHQQIVNDLVNYLGAAADLYNNKCGGGPPPPSPVAAPSPAPSSSPSSISPKAVIIGVLIVGTAIALAPATGGGATDACILAGTLNPQAG